MLVDQKLVLLETTTSLAGTTLVNGSLEVELPKNQDLAGITSVVVVIGAAGFPAAGTTEINLCGGPAAAPTVKTQPIFNGLSQELVPGKTLRVGISPGQLKEFNRISIKNSAAQAGASALAYLSFD